MTRRTRKPTGSPTESSDLSESDSLRLLESDRRKLSLDVLARRTAPVELTDLAAGVAAREDDLEAADERTVDRVAVTLHHVHLPVMAELGVVDYDPDANRVESCTRRFDARLE